MKKMFGGITWDCQNVNRIIEHYQGFLRTNGRCGEETVST
jgi:hypothetical protein